LFVLIAWYPSLLLTLIFASSRELTLQHFFYQRIKVHGASVHDAQTALRGDAVIMVQMRTTKKETAIAKEYEKSHMGLYGAAKRDVTNLPEVAEALRRSLLGAKSPFARAHRGLSFAREVRVASVDGLALKEQIRLHHDVDVGSEKRKLEICMS
jgi:hypothetical protein